MFYKSEILKQKVYKTGQVSKIMGVSIQTVEQPKTIALSKPMI